MQELEAEVERLTSEHRMEKREREIAWANVERLEAELKLKEHQRQAQMREAGVEIFRLRTVLESALTNHANLRYAIAEALDKDTDKEPVHTVESSLCSCPYTTYSVGICTRCGKLRSVGKGEW
jgi:hypothetical protein